MVRQIGSNVCARVSDDLSAGGAPLAGPDHFWEAYATDRYNLLVPGVSDGGGDEEDRKKARSEWTSPSPMWNSTRYLVYLPGEFGLGNQMFGMMSAFALSIVTKRVFLHEWAAPIEQ